MNIFRRNRRAAARAGVQPVDYGGVYQPPINITAGETSYLSNGTLPRGPEVRRLLDLDTLSRSFSDYSPGYGGRLESPIQVLRRVQARRLLPRGLPSVRVTRPATPPVDLRRIDESWRQFRALSVRVPERVAFCVRRRTRREVLFAKRVAGRNTRRSPGRGGTYHRSQESSWSC